VLDHTKLIDSTFRGPDRSLSCQTTITGCVTW